MKLYLCKRETQGGRFYLADVECRNETKDKLDGSGKGYGKREF